MKNFLLRVALLPACLLLFFSCVPKDQYEALVIERDYYRNKTVTMDSLADQRSLNKEIVVDNSAAENAETTRKLETLTATNQALNNSYQSLLTRYNDLLAQDKKLLNNTGEEVTGLQASLAERTRAITEKETELAQKEMQLKAREDLLASNQSDPASGTDGQVPDDRVVVGGRPPLSAQQNAALRMNTIQSDLTQLLNYLPSGTYAVKPVASNQLRVSLAEALFTQDGYNISPSGQSLLRRMTLTLRNYPAVEIGVTGHVDASTTDPTEAYEDSTDKAIAIAMLLKQYGLNPAKITAGGKGFYSPVMDNATEDGRTANRRLDVLVTVPE